MKVKKDGKKRRSKRRYLATLVNNESLCSAYRVLLGKCNSLFKQSKIDGFYTMNGNVKIKTGGRKDETGKLVGYEVTKIGHVADLETKFGKQLMDTLIRKR